MGNEKKNLKILNPTEISGEIHLTWSEKKKARTSG